MKIMSVKNVRKMNFINNCIIIYKKITYNIILMCTKTQQKLCDNDECSLCYNRSFKIHEKSKYWSKKNLVTPRQVCLHSGKKFLFDCNKCNHEFNAILNDISRSSKKSWCPFCASSKLCDNKECKTCLKNSFALHEKSKYWSKKNLVTPRQVFMKSDKKFIFDCECGHEFEMSLHNINNSFKGSWCPFCATPSRKLCDKEECKSCENNSFASCTKSKFWSFKNEIKPRNVFKNSHNKYIFDCDKCGHEFDITLNHVAAVDNRWCPFCSSQKLCENKECKICHEKSFASNIKVEYWSVKNKIDPREVFKNSNLKFIFDCPYCKQEYISVLSSINNNRWCSCRTYKTEKKLLDFLLTLNLNIKKEVKFNWCNKSRFDFYIEDKLILLECDGSHHHKDVNYWKSNVIKVQNKDFYKMECAIKNNFSIIRIYQLDVWKDNFDWKTVLIDTIKNCKQQEIHYIGKNGTEYDQYKINWEKYKINGPMAIPVDITFEYSDEEDENDDESPNITFEDSDEEYTNITFEDSDEELNDITQKLIVT